MNTVSASYNFQPGFLWGVSPYEGFDSDKENFSYIFKLQEKHIGALLLNVPWAGYEPLKGNFDEEAIETLRTLLTRIRSRNIEPVVILDTTALPTWQNLSHPQKAEENAAYEFNFCSHLAEAILPYAKYFGLFAPETTLFSFRKQQAALETFRKFCGHIHQLSESAKTGMFLRPGFFTKDPLKQARQRYLSSIESDFFCICADKDSIAGIRSIFGNEKKCPLFLYDLIGKSEAGATMTIFDSLYDTWQLYQNGWPLLGYFTGIDPLTESPELSLYANSGENNAFEIAGDTPGLPEKWFRFLKD